MVAAEGCGGGNDDGRCGSMLRVHFKLYNFVYSPKLGPCYGIYQENPVKQDGYANATFAE